MNIAVGERAAWPGAFPQRLLVIDEFGTFAGMAARMHRRAGQVGPAPGAGPAAADRMAGKAFGTDAPIRADVQRELAAVRAEQDHRARLAAYA